MTKALPFTELAVRRAISAARKEGVPFAISLAPDGTITIFQQQAVASPPMSAPPRDPEADNWSKD
jgi:hypothetical protein